MIIGNDLDAVLSAVYLHHKFGWDIVGIYDYHRLWLDNQAPDILKQLLQGRYLCVDLDIYHANIPSIGHHVLEWSGRDALPGHRLTLNPNCIAGIEQTNFRHKYPLATIHFLLWMLEEGDLDLETSLFVWLADSSYINAQSHRFRENVAAWLLRLSERADFCRVMQVLDSNAYEKVLSREILSRLSQLKICTQRGQVRSRFQGMTGFQCQWQNPNRSRRDILRLLEITRRITGWQIPSLPRQFNRMEGTRSIERLARIYREYENMDAFLHKKGVFSYAIHFNGRINYSHTFLFGDSAISRKAL